MEKTEQHIWQRVMSPAAEVPLEIKALILESEELMAGFGLLAKRAREDRKPLLRKLQLQEQEILRTLKGICRLQGKEVPIHSLKAPREPEARLLEKSYRKCLQLRQEYLARSAAGEFAQVFRLLADRAGEQCERILRVLGML